VLFVPLWFISFSTTKTLRNTKKKMLSTLRAFVVDFFLTTKTLRNTKKKILSALCAFVVDFFLTTKKLRNTKKKNLVLFVPLWLIFF